VFVKFINLNNFLTPVPLCRIVIRPLEEFRPAQVLVPNNKVFSILLFLQSKFF